MRKAFTFITIACFVAVAITACKKDTKPTAAEEEISTETLSQIKSLGFSTSDVHKAEDGYLVEGDILLTPELLNGSNEGLLLRVANEEQYRTTNLVAGLPKNITVGTTGLSQPYIDGAKLAINRYNGLGLQLSFSFVTKGKPDILIRGFNQPPSGGYITLGSAGFPSRGEPYGTIKMNTNQYAYGSNPDVNYVGSVIQHEIGHCIGFRHTDFMDRSYSCGGAKVNEGASNVGAVFIPGTATGPDANSWMLACSDGGDQTFNANDKLALNYLY